MTTRSSIAQMVGCRATYACSSTYAIIRMLFYVRIAPCPLLAHPPPLPQSPPIPSIPPPPATVDLVSIVTPPYLHRTQFKAALQAGKHVLVDKPMALNASEAEDMLQAASAVAASDPQRVVMVDHEMRFAPAFRRARELVHSGALGTLGLCSVNVMVPPLNKWVLGVEQVGVGGVGLEQVGGDVGGVGVESEVGDLVMCVGEAVVCGLCMHPLQSPHSTTITLPPTTGSIIGGQMHPRVVVCCARWAPM